MSFQTKIEIILLYCKYYILPLSFLSLLSLLSLLSKMFKLLSLLIICIFCEIVESRGLMSPLWSVKTINKPILPEYCSTLFGLTVIQKYNCALLELKTTIDTCPFSDRWFTTSFDKRCQLPSEGEFNAHIDVNQHKYIVDDNNVFVNEKYISALKIIKANRDYVHTLRNTIENASTKKKPLDVKMNIRISRFLTSCENFIKASENYINH